MSRWLDRDEGSYSVRRVQADPICSIVCDFFRRTSKLVRVGRREMVCETCKKIFSLNTARDAYFVLGHSVLDEDGHGI